MILENLHLKKEKTLRHCHGLSEIPLSDFLDDVSKDVIRKKDYSEKIKRNISSKKDLQVYVMQILQGTQDLRYGYVIAMTLSIYYWAGHA